MKIVHSGFDSLYFSLQGALSAKSVERFKRLKDQAIQHDSDASFAVPNQPYRYLMKKTGKKGGYTYVINTGLVGSDIAFKSSLRRDQHNGFVEISSACLLAHGREAAIEQTLDHVKAMGFHVISISLNRVDFCIDFLDAPIDIDPRDFIAHSRVKKLCYYESDSVNHHVEMQPEHVDIRTISQSDSIKSITLGKMPGRQIIIYNKRAEVIEKRKHYWFDAWGVDQKDTARTVHRVEVRAGKSHLMANGIRTLEDFESHIGLILTNAVTAIRWVQRPSTDANVTRAPLHPVWEAVQTRIVDALAPYTSPIAPELITERMRENKRLEYRQQIIGNLGGYLGCDGVAPNEMKTAMESLIAEVAEGLAYNEKHPLIRSYSRAKEKWAVLDNEPAS